MFYTSMFYHWETVAECHVDEFDSEKHVPSITCLNASFYTQPADKNEQANKWDELQWGYKKPREQRV